MLFEGKTVGSLPQNSQEAFVEFESNVREEYEQGSRNDRDHNSDQNGNYDGSYGPERSYVTAILAFLDEYSLETEIEDISDLSNTDFNKAFGRFKSKVEYIITRYRLRRDRIESGGIGTQISFDSNYKTEIGSHLEKIRKIVNQEVDKGVKKDNIFAKIASLQSEVDRDQTTVDAAFGRLLDLSKVMGEAGANMKPAVDQLERLKKIFWDNSEKVEQLPKPNRPKRIEKEVNSDDLDDEIPF